MSELTGLERGIWPQSKPPNVSVIMASYNGAAYVADAVHSLSAQTFTDFELIIVDDGSAAPTRAILRELAAADPRIRLFEHDHAGLIKALNAAIGYARGTYLARLDHDDIALPRRLELQADYLDRHPGAIAVGCEFATIDPRGQIVAEPPARRRLLTHAPTAFPPEPIWMPGSTVMARTQAMVAIGGYRAPCLAAEDRDLCWRLGALGPTDRLELILVHWRSHGGNMSYAKRQIQLASHIISDLSALAAHYKRDDRAILERVEIGGDYHSVFSDYIKLLHDDYPTETYLYYLLVKRDAWQLSGATAKSEFRSRVWAHVAARPYLPRRLKLAKAAWRDRAQ